MDTMPTRAGPLAAATAPWGWRRLHRAPLVELLLLAAVAWQVRTALLGLAIVLSLAGALAPVTRPPAYRAALSSWGVL